jgi:hypothetical protein
MYSKASACFLYSYEYRGSAQPYNDFGYIVLSAFWYLVWTLYIYMLRGCLVYPSSG